MTVAVLACACAKTAKTTGKMTEAKTGVPTAACGKAVHAAMHHCLPGVDRIREGRKSVVVHPTASLGVAGAVCKLALSGPVVLLLEAPTEIRRLVPGNSSNQLHMVQLLVTRDAVMRNKQKATFISNLLINMQKINYETWRNVSTGRSKVHKAFHQSKKM